MAGLTVFWRGREARVPAGSMRPVCRRFSLRRQSCSSRLPLFSPPSLPSRMVTQRLPNLGYRHTDDSRSFAPGTGRPNPDCAWRAGRTEKRASGASGSLRTRAKTGGAFPVGKGLFGPLSYAGEGSEASGRGPSLPGRPCPFLTRKTALLITQSSTAPPKSRATTSPTSWHRLGCQDMIADARYLVRLERHGGRGEAL